jgi:hypothetical protein
MGWELTVNYKDCYKNNKDFLYNGMETDFYSSTYFSSEIEQLILDYQFKSLKLQIIDNKFEKDIKKSFVKRNKRFKETIKLILDSDITYDYVILTRYDIFFKQKPFELNVNYCNINVICGAKWGDDDTIIDDSFYFMPYSKLQEFYNAIDLIDEEICSHEYNKYISDIHRMIDDNFYSHDIPTYTLHRKLI